MASSSAVELADIAIVWSNTTGDGDVVLIDDDVASDRGLLTAMELSLFTDRRANDDDVPPSGDPQDRRGWWGDEFASVPGDLIGSRLWLLSRAKLTNGTLQLAESYVREALQWLLDDKVAASIDVAVTKTGPQSILIAGEVARPTGDKVPFSFTHVWDHLQEDL